MIIKTLFFAAIREQLDCSELSIELNSELNTIADLIAILRDKGPQWQKAFNDPTILVAVNQNIVDDSQQLHKNDTVAFFPPVTGG